MTCAVLCAGCRDEPRAWESGGGALPPPSAAAPPIVAASDAGGLDAAAALDAEVPSLQPEIPVRVGGAWIRCYGGFRPSGDPARDVTRLGLMCGPANGMRRVGEAWAGEVVEGGIASSTKLPAKAGDCYRVFAVADSGISDLDVSVQSSRGASIARDHGDDAWPIVQPDRPVCVLEDDVLTVEVSARRGRGRFAAEAWRLGTRPPKSPVSQGEGDKDPFE